MTVVDGGMAGVCPRRLTSAIRNGMGGYERLTLGDTGRSRGAALMPFATDKAELGKANIRVLSDPSG